MLYSTKSPYYRQFLSSAVNRKYQKNLEKAQGTISATQNKDNENPPKAWLFIPIDSDQ